MTTATAVSERGILFTDRNVRAILECRKTQTRRTRGLKAVNESPDDWTFDRWQRYPDGSVRAVFDHIPSGEPNAIGLRCPYGVPGDRLWGREAWRMARINGVIGGVVEFATVQFREGFGVLDYRRDWREFYADLLASEQQWTPSETGNLWGRWRPSIFMPRWASRITLAITDVRVERVQDISEEDARAEGAPYYVYGHGPVTQEALRAEPGYWGQGSYRAGFEHGWNEIHGWSPSAWDRNDFVWAITSRRLEETRAVA